MGWVFSGTDKTVAMLKLVLKLYVTFMEKGLSPADEVAFFQRFLIGSHAAEMDVPEQRLAARVSAEIAGLPADFVDSYAARVSAVSPAEVNAAIKRHVHARDLAITMVASAPGDEEAAHRGQDSGERHRRRPLRRLLSGSRRRIRRALKDARRRRGVQNRCYAPVVNERAQQKLKKAGVRVLGSGRYLTLLDDGGWEYVTRPDITGIVVIVAITDDDKLLLVEQHRPAVRGQRDRAAGRPRGRRRRAARA